MRNSLQTVHHICLRHYATMQTKKDILKIFTRLSNQSQNSLLSYSDANYDNQILTYDTICQWLSSPNVDQVMQPMSDNEKDTIGELLDKILVLEQRDRISVKNRVPLFALSKMKNVSCCNFSKNNEIDLSQFTGHIIHFPKNDRSEKQWNLVHQVENIFGLKPKFYSGKRRNVFCSDSINFFAKLLKLEDLSKQLLNLCFCSSKKHNDLLHYAILTNTFRQNQCGTYEQQMINSLHAGDLDFLYEAQNVDYHQFPTSIIDFYIDIINHTLKYK